MRRLVLALLAALAYALALPSILSAQNEGRPTPCTLVPQPTTRLRYDSLPGIGAVSFIGGGVDLRCPQRGITLKGDSAERFPDHDQVVGHAIYDEPRVHVTSDFLNYFPNDERIVAAGTVRARLPNGSTLVGPQAELKRAVPRIRPRQEITAIARPTITIVQKDSAGREARDTTIVIANNVYMNGDSLIYGWGQVVITRPEIVANADSAFIDETHEVMNLRRNPVIHGKKEKPFTLSGDLIDLYSKDRKMTRVMARANAKAVSDSMTLTSDTLDLRVKNDQLDHAYAWGKKSRARVVSPSQNMLADSLDVYMPLQRVQLVRALGNADAHGRPDTVRFSLVKPDTTDWLLGDTIIAHFDSLPPKDTAKTAPIRQLVSTGHASSLYHLAASDSGERRPAINHVTARVITVDFNKQKVATVTTVDSVFGVYIEPKPDSTKKRNATSTTPNPNAPKQGTAPKVPSVVPLPPKPPTSP